MKGERTKVLLADDHTIVREGLLSLLHEQQDIVVVGAAENGHEAVEKARRTFPDVVIMDVAMPLLNGIEATRQLTRLLPQTKVIVLTMYVDEEYVLRISRVVVERFLASDDPGAEEAVALSERERQILQLVAEGYTNRQIATALGITPKTVDTHRTRLMTKLDIHDTPGLVRYAIRKGLVRADD